jgi:hypothetical protein
LSVLSLCSFDAFAGKKHESKAFSSDIKEPAPTKIKEVPFHLRKIPLGMDIKRQPLFPFVNTMPVMLTIVGQSRLLQTAE